VNVAHVPPTYHVPLLIKQPTCDPSAVKALKVPVPLKVTGVPVGADAVVVFVTRVVCAVVGMAVWVVVGRGLPDLGRYLTPVDGQVDLDPSISVSGNIDRYLRPAMTRDPNNYGTYLG
jgi:hypothetical protein